MPGGHGVGDALHRDPDVERLADRDVARVLVVVGMAEVEDAAGDDRRRAVGRDVAQPRGDERARPVGGDPQLTIGCPSISKRSATGAESKVSERASSRRWSTGMSAGLP